MSYHLNQLQLHSYHSKVHIPRKTSHKYLTKFSLISLEYTSKYITVLPQITVQAFISFQWILTRPLNEIGIY